MFRHAGAGPRNRLFEGGGAWVEAFADVPKAYELAQSARSLQQLGLGTLWGGYAVSGAFLGVILVSSMPGEGLSLASPAGIAATSGVLVAFVSLEIVAVIAHHLWTKRVEQAVHVYNSALNDSLPEEQRFDLAPRT